MIYPEHNKTTYHVKLHFFCKKTTKQMAYKPQNVLIFQYLAYLHFIKLFFLTTLKESSCLSSKNYKSFCLNNVSWKGKQHVPQ